MIHTEHKRGQGRGVKVRILTLLGLGLLLAAGQSQAQIVLTPTVTSVGNEFQYDYSVTNNSPDTTYYVVSLQGLPGENTVFNLAAPTGFQINYDSSLGLITFLADSQSFDPTTTVSGFTFDSFLPPTTTSTESTGLDPLGNGVVTDGTAPGPVPEPGMGGLLVAGVTATLLTLRRKRK